MKRKTRTVMVGPVRIGGGSPVTIQSMTTTPTSNVGATVRQIKRLQDAGCDIVRVAVPDEQSARAIERIKRAVSIPVVADIHFNYRLAIVAADAGADKLRINPGNIGSPERVRAVVEKAREHGIPIRIGVNSGSIEKHIFARLGASPEAMVESALCHTALLESFGFRDIVLSLKASSVRDTIAAYRLISRRVRYPLHLGVTEAGTEFSGTVRSAMGIGALLNDGTGDTLRVSLSADPVKEVRVAREILISLGLAPGPRLVSCPTCARARIDVIRLARRVEKALEGCRKNVTVAVMGCSVNGPGEAKGADLCITGGGAGYVFYRNGRKIGTYKDDVIELLMRTIDAEY